MPLRNQKALLAIVLLLGAAAPLSAALANHAPGHIDNPIGPNATFSTIIENITKFANSLLAPLSTLMVLIAGFLYLTAGGNQEKVKLAHRTIIWALVGIGLVILANSVRIIIEQVLKG